MIVSEEIEKIRERKNNMREGSKARADLDLLLRVTDLYESYLQKLIGIYDSIELDIESDELDENQMDDYEESYVVQNARNALHFDDVDLYPEDCLQCDEELDEDANDSVCESCLSDSFCEECGEKSTECVCLEECPDCGYEIADCACEDTD